MLARAWGCARPSALRRSCASNAESRRHLSLAYALHEPKGRTPGPASEDGENEGPLVILHGLFGSKQNNRSISKALARDLNVPVYALDLRNHGDSPHDPEHTYSSMADDVEEFFEEHGIKSPVLIGHSMGAKVAMTVALRSPHLLKALIPVDNAPIDAQLKSNFHQYVQGMRKIEEWQVKKQAQADGILQQYEEALPIRQFLLTNLVRGTDGFLKMRVPVRILAASLDNMGDFPFKDPELNRFDGPTLFVRGTKSHYVADDVLPVMGQFFPRFLVHDIDCGHWVISEQPGAFRKVVEQEGPPISQAVAEAGGTKTAYPLRSQVCMHMEQSGEEFLGILNCVREVYELLPWQCSLPIHTPASVRFKIVCASIETSEDSAARAAELTNDEL